MREENDKMKFNISILIPAYNVEKTIKRTLDSLLDQTRKDFEVIIVNDGSTDRTQDILEAYRKKSDIFQVYRQNNSGVAIARQVLVEKASGTYLLFCDADDYFEVNAVEAVYNAIEQHNTDLLIYGYNLVRKVGNKSVLRRQLLEGTYVKSDWEQLHINCLSDLYWSALWNKCFKKEILEKPPALKFQRILEDVIFNVEYMGRCKSIYIMEQTLYNYAQIGESLTRGKKPDSDQKIKDAFDTFSYLRGALKVAYPDTDDDINKYMYIMLSGLCDRAKRLNNKDIYIEIRNSEFFYQVKKGLGCKYYKTVLTRIVGKLKNTIRVLLRR